MRTQTPIVRDEDQKLFFRLSESEGHYDSTLDLVERKVEIWFAFFHQGAFKPAIKVHEEWFSERESALSFFASLRWKWSYQAFFDFEKKYLTPMRDREKRIVDMGHDPRRKTYRQRNHKKFYVQMFFEKEYCDNWCCNHHHAVRIKIYDADTYGIAHEESFDCDHVWEGIERYHDILNRFDLVYMEMHL